MEKKAHVVLMERNDLLVREVDGVEGFDESRIVLRTTLGRLEIKGEGLEITALDLENHQIIAQGKVVGLNYLEEKGERLRKKGKRTVNRLLH